MTEQIDKTHTKDKDNSIFTLKEKKDVVKGFIRARIAGKVKIDYVTKEHLAECMRVKGIPLSDDEAQKRSLQLIENINDMVNQCTRVDITESEQNKSIDDLFQHLLLMRGGDRIQGDFWDYSLEQRLEDLEEKVDSTINVLQKEVRWLKEQMNV